MKNKYILITFAVLITIGASIYQKLVGPTHPDWMKTELNGTDYSYKLRRSNDGEFLAPIKIEIADEKVSAKIHFKHYPVKEGEEYRSEDFKREGDYLFAELPHQKAAGKLMYYIEFITDNGSVFEKKDTPIVLRYRDPVPDWVLVPHIFFMFFAMMLSNLSGLKAAFNSDGYKKIGKYSIMALVIGGFVFGPLMQKFAFGEYWTGVPFGFDLTDNKTLIAFLVWAFALWHGSKKENSRMVFIVASLALLAVFMIPHSVLGSELDRNSGEVVTGMIAWLF
ncbi:MAG: hypothetical protein KAG37_08900 [Flavobacteriales bacterium]|nr:hypothetical protein [Flavobacteriales bacterium]